VRRNNINSWIARLLIAVVVAWNLQCALVFLINPGFFAPGFELSGIPGEAAIRGLAVLFVMWNIPYLVALWDPRKYRVSLIEAVVMQVIGVLGESAIYFSIPAGHPALQASVVRFIVFDAAGIICLTAAAIISRLPHLSS
jgi:hypothetical protein